MMPGHNLWFVLCFSIALADRGLSEDAKLVSVVKHETVVSQKMPEEITTALEFSKHVKEDIEKQLKIFKQGNSWTGKLSKGWSKMTRGKVEEAYNPCEAWQQLQLKACADLNHEVKTEDDFDQVVAEAENVVNIAEMVKTEMEKFYALFPEARKKTLALWEKDKDKDGKLSAVPGTPEYKALQEEAYERLRPLGEQLENTKTLAKDLRQVSPILDEMIRTGVKKAKCEAAQLIDTPGCEGDKKDCKECQNLK
eukprot:gnl/TRDRNA2_/TRDRNA2_194849_c0_seq1.p1 gnl/TRDRNA2_/TRDRNA2_194849_c0~~gnl/TRDRNA2_/TRDRNA2_194849_c0_seq1.p1  ORF type:complete len:252 (+),score=68.10 gnl/TRDRNA2_/TRDRNA2_194849_c0_seq1:157-912(+)